MQVPHVRMDNATRVSTVLSSMATYLLSLRSIIKSSLHTNVVSLKQAKRGAIGGCSCMCCASSAVQLLPDDLHLVVCCGCLHQSVCERAIGFDGHDEGEAWEKVARSRSMLLG